jgi:hypothetical protein
LREDPGCCEQPVLMHGPILTAQRSSQKPGAYEFPENPPQDEVAITISGRITLILGLH